MQKGLLVILIALVAIAAAGTIYVFSINPTEEDPTNDPTHPLNQSSEWVCLAQDETHDFTLTVREIAEQSDTGVTCPECGSGEVMRALPCPECGRHYPVARYNASPKYCLYCNAELPGADISIFHGQEGH